MGVKVWGESIWKRKEISRKRNGCVSVDVRNVEIEEGRSDLEAKYVEE